MFRRLRKGIPGGLPTPAQENAYQMAGQFMSKGKFNQAALIYAQLAQDFHIASHPRRAANLHAQAAHAYTDSGNQTQALHHAQAALRMFQEYQMVERIPRFYSNILRRMRSCQMMDAVEAIETEFSTGVSPLPGPVVRSNTSVRLPAACPQCSAPVRSDEVDWIDSHSAECIYCGAVIPGLP